MRLVLMLVVGMRHDGWLHVVSFEEIVVLDGTCIHFLVGSFFLVVLCLFLEVIFPVYGLAGPSWNLQSGLLGLSFGCSAH